MILAITGNTGSGKDTVAKMIQYYYACKCDSTCNKKYSLNDFLNQEEYGNQLSGFQVKKFALKIKQIAADLVGCDVSKFEEESFKATVMPDRFQVWIEGDRFSEHTYRWLLQHLADKIKELLGENYFVDELFSTYEEGKIKNATSFEFDGEKDGILRRTRNLESNWIISDMRYLKEAATVKERNGIVIKVLRPPYEHNHTHSSETQLSGIVPDYTIYNDGTIDELYVKVSNLLSIL